MKTKEETQIIEYDITTAAIEEMKLKYGGMKITDAKSDKAVRAARTFMVSKRTAVEKRRVELNEEANEHRRRVNQKAKDITALLLPIEEPLQAEVKRVDDVIEAKREEKAQKERERIEVIQEKINSIRTLGTVHNVSSPAIEERIFLTGGIEISEEVYGEFVDQAIECQKEAIAALEKALSERIQFEKDEAARKAEAERLEKVHKEQEEAQAKIDKENRRIELKQHELEEKERKAELRKAQQEFEHQATIKAEQEAKDKVEQAERERLEKEEAEAKEKARQESLRPDKEKLIEYADAILNMKMPRLISDTANQVLVHASKTLNKLAKDIKEQADKL